MSPEVGGSSKASSSGSSAGSESVPGRLGGGELVAALLASCCVLSRPMVGVGHARCNLGMADTFLTGSEFWVGLNLVKLV